MRKTASKRLRKPDFMSKSAWEVAFQAIFTRQISVQPNGYVREQLLNL